MKNLKDKLKQDILLLEVKRNADLKSLKEEFHALHESLKPINQLKNLFRNVSESPDIKKGLAKVAIGSAAGYLVKNLLFRSSTNPLKKLAGMAIQSMVSNLAANNSEKIKESGTNIFQTIISKVFHKKEMFSEQEVYD